MPAASPGSASRHSHPRIANRLTGPQYEAFRARPLPRTRSRIAIFTDNEVGAIGSRRRGGGAMSSGRGILAFLRNGEEVYPAPRLRRLTILMTACALCACAADPSVSRQVGADPLLQRQNGVLLLVDASVQIETLIGKDYFVIGEAKSGAKATLASLRKYAEESGVPIRGEIVTVAGARLSKDDSPILVADSAGKPAPPRAAAAFGSRCDRERSRVRRCPESDEHLCHGARSGRAE